MYFLIVILCAFLVFAIYMAVKSYKQNVERENNYIRVKMSRLGSITGYKYNQIVRDRYQFFLKRQIERR